MPVKFNQVIAKNCLLDKHIDYRAHLSSQTPLILSIQAVDGNNSGSSTFTLYILSSLVSKAGHVSPTAVILVLIKCKFGINIRFTEGFYQSVNDIYIGIYSILRDRDSFFVNISSGSILTIFHEDDSEYINSSWFQLSGSFQKNLEDRVQTVE